MNLKMLAITTAFALTSIQAAADQIPAGVWKQTSSTAGECKTCEMTVKKVTSHLIEFTGNNATIGYAHYSLTEDKYVGAFEWQQGKGGAYDNILFLIELRFDGKTLSTSAKSTPLSFTATYVKK